MKDEQFAAQIRRQGDAARKAQHPAGRGRLWIVLGCVALVAIFAVSFVADGKGGELVAFALWCVWAGLFVLIFAAIVSAFGTGKPLRGVLWIVAAVAYLAASGVFMWFI